MLPSFDDFLDAMGTDYLKSIADEYSEQVTGLYFGDASKQLSDLALSTTRFSLRMSLRILRDYHEWLRKYLL